MMVFQRRMSRDEYLRRRLLNRILGVVIMLITLPIGWLGLQWGISEAITKALLAILYLFLGADSQSGLESTEPGQSSTGFENDLFASIAALLLTIAFVFFVGRYGFRLLRHR